MTKPATPPNASELGLYQGEEGRSRIQLRFDGGTVWLTQRLLAKLYQVAVPTITEHLAHIFAEQDLDPALTIRKFRLVQPEGNRDVEVPQKLALDRYTKFERTRLPVEASEPDEFDKAAKQLGTKKPGKPEKGGR